MQLCLDLGMLGQQPPRERQGQRDRLVSGDIEIDHLVAHLPIGHARAVLVLGAQQGREQVAVVSIARAVLGDDLFDDRL